MLHVQFIATDTEVSYPGDENTYCVLDLRLVS